MTRYGVHESTEGMKSVVVRKIASVLKIVTIPLYTGLNTH